MFEQQTVIVGGADVLAQADHHHLEQAALDGAVKTGVRLDAGHDADVIGFGGESIQHYRIAFVGCSQGNHVHRGADGGADGLFGDAVAFEDASLAVGRAAAVAAHRGDEKGAGAEFFQEGGRFPQDERDVGDAAAAGRQCDRLTGTDASGKIEPFQGAGNGGGNVLDERTLEMLADANDGGMRHARLSLGA